MGLSCKAALLPEPRPWTLDIHTGAALINAAASAMTLPALPPARGRARPTTAANLTPANR